ncbi:hypothetical protein [Nocardioides sp. InS609-2]|uniref:hypothetical protein n=1 Tax=Nocardioides sp. InS609-2 TaxID=2760705 RepID=UPI0020C036D0|nr:hypothetical protein [Nocardioides sp. InS609-2]
MPTAHSWTEPAELRRAVSETRELVRFRARTVRRPGAAGRFLAVLLGLSAAAALTPAWVPGGGGDDKAFGVLLVLPSMLAGFLSLAIVSAVASGGGRELLARDHAVAFPVSPTTDHLGALVMAPLNIAWILQAWTLLGAGAYALGPGGLPYLLPAILLWIIAATALAQVVAWTSEAVRRGPHGAWIVRGITTAALVGAVWLQLSGRLTDFFDAMPTKHLVVTSVRMMEGWTWTWPVALLVEVLLIVGAVLVGIVPAHAASKRVPRDELRIETGVYPSRPSLRGDIPMLVRIDRGSIWRSVPMRRGLIVLAIGPGAIAMAGGLDWTQITVLPGLVASGGALLFGVNAWCLDGRGALWRESLPVEPSAVFSARSWVLAEWLLLGAVVTVVLASLRAGTPTTAEATAIACTLVAVIAQVVAVAMGWAGRRPFSVDMRSARATPAPPLVMVGYSTRLAISTTLTGLVFSALALVPDWRVSVLVAVPFLAWSTFRLLRARRRWLDAPERARVVLTVAA